MSERTPAPSARKRRFTQRRLPHGRAKATCRRVGPVSEADLALAILDVSETGVRLIVKETLKPGGEVCVGLQGQSHARPIQRTGKVAWALPTRDGAWCIGVEFHRRLAYRDFLEFARNLPAFGLPAGRH